MPLADHVEVRLGRKQAHGAVGHVRGDGRIKQGAELAEARELLLRKGIHPSPGRGVVGVSEVGIDARHPHMRGRVQRL